MSEGLIGSALQCTGCGYNLFGISAAGVCPECGQSVQSSIHATDLVAYERRWLKIIAVGIQLILIRYFVIAIYPITYLLTYVDRPEVRTIRSFVQRKDIRTGLFFIDVAAYSLGIWLISARTPRSLNGGPARSEEFHLRYFLRLAIFLLAPFWILRRQFPIPRGAPLNFLSCGSVCLTGLAEFVLPVIFWLLIEKDLAVRARQEAISRQAAWIKWIAPGVNLAGLIASGAISGWSRPFGMLPSQFNLLLDLARIGLYSWSIIVLFQLLRPFESAHKPDLATPN